MGSPLDLPMASFQLLSGNLDEANRPDPKAVKKAKAKISNLPSSLHPESSSQCFVLFTTFYFLCQLFSFWMFRENQK
jgi:hypothetical protein